MLLEIKNLSLMFADRILFEEANFTLYAGQRYGLIGPNGAGKSSLFNIILRRLTADSGEVIYSKDLQLSYCEQECSNLEAIALDYVIAGHSQSGQIWGELKKAQEQEDYEKVAELTTKLDTLGTFDLEAQASVILTGLGFSSHELKQPVKSFSGGWRMRLNLARSLLTPSELLILDEPTNHLDFEAILWLEKWLSEYKGTLFLVSHDKSFLDALVTHIMSIEQNTFKLYKGNYSQYNQTKLLQEMALESARQKAEKQRAHLESFINRFKAKASKAAQAQSRIKALEKLPDIKLLSKARGYELNFQIDHLPSYPALALKNSDLGYPNQEPLIKNISFSLGPDQKIGILGANGAGKSTLLKALAGALKVEGLVIDKKTKIGYFAQHQVESLDLEQSALDIFSRHSPELSVLERRKYLARYGFCENKVHDLVKYYSGGERSRLTLALLLWHKPNVLLLDEPTNHLDIQVREALCSALQLFEGALIIISHDKSLLSSCVDTLYLVEKGSARLFEGSLKDYELLLRKQSVEKKRQQNLSKESQKSTKAQEELSFEFKKHLDKLERKMKKLQLQAQSLDQKMAQVSEKGDLDKLFELTEEKNKLLQQLEQLEEQWLNDQEL